MILPSKPTACGGLLALALIASPLLHARADETPLNINPGLWEVRTTSHSAGQMPIPEDELAKLPPDRRAKLEAAMKAAMERAAAPHVFKECITAQQIKDGLKLADKQRPNCKRTVLSSSPTLMEMREECSDGAEKSNAHYRFEATDTSTMHGAIDMVMTRGARTMTMKGQVEGKRLSADCGSIKPGAPQLE